MARASPRIMIRAIIFDLNGVFIRSPKLSERFAEAFGVPSEQFLPALNGVMARARLPNAGDSFAYWQPYLKRWGVVLTREQFFSFWFGAEEEVPEMTALARELKARGLKLMVLSNNFAERTEYYEKTFPFLHEIFDRVYFSWRTGFTKSNPQAYQLVLEENRLAAEECLFLDDSPENIAVASALGIRGFLFEGLDRLREVLHEYQLI
ncbi:HAD family phosphatase [Candidatus Parcubacteria bacterium]|nr:HAD family phosphatase [Candidatus Parcubacteria bacterium]